MSITERDRLISKHPLEPGLDYPGIVVLAIVLDDENKILLARPFPHSVNPQGLFELPATVRNKGESPKDAAVRAALEDASLGVFAAGMGDTLMVIHGAYEWIVITYLCDSDDDPHPSVSGEARGMIESVGFHTHEEVLSFLNRGLVSTTFDEVLRRYFMTEEVTHR